WQVQQRGAASSRGGKRVGRGGAIVRLSQATPATDAPASPVLYAQVAKQLIAPMPLLDDLKKQQERCASPPVPCEPVVYKSFIIENPLGNWTRFVQNPLRRICGILADEVPRTIRELSYIGVAKSTLELVDYDEAVAKLSTPVDPSLPPIFVTADLLQVPEHWVFGLPGSQVPTQDEMEDTFIKRRAVMLECALREQVPVMTRLAVSNVDQFIGYQIHEAALLRALCGSFKHFYYPNPITWTNFDKIVQEADDAITIQDYVAFESSPDFVNQVAKRSNLTKDDAKRQVKNFIRAFPTD
ncbi:hypothetical protein HDU80_004043, partial [Chytriomyces hyalinus]